MKILPALLGGIPVRNKFLSFSMPDIQEEDIEAAVTVMRSGWLSTGKEVTNLEYNFTLYKNVKHALALSSCTAALHLALLSLPIDKGSDILVTDFTFSATAATILHAGMNPIFVDCDPDTLNICVNDLERKITKNTKALVIVHFAGLPCDMNEIVSFCKSNNVFLIEDCAHAIESTYKDKHCGTFGDIGCFSFYGTKNITTAIGEGGMLITNNDKVINRARTLSLHGMSKNAATRYSDSGFKHYDILEPGFKYNMSDVAAAFCNSQLKRIEYNWNIRKSIWERYNKEFEDLPILKPYESPIYIKHAYHLYTIQIGRDELSISRDQVLNALTKEGIGVGVHYTALHNHSFWKQNFNLKSQDFPNADWLSKNTLSIPISASLSIDNVNDVINAVRRVLAYFKKDNINAE